MNGEFDLRIQAAEGIEEGIAWHTVGVVANGGEGIGTGSAILWRGHPLILTAGHVVRGTQPQDLWFFFRAEGTLQRGEANEIPMQENIRLAIREHITIQAIHYDQEKDLAALQVPLSLQEQRNVRFHELDPTSTTPNAGTTVVMMGYPADIAVRVQGADRAVFPSLEWARIEGNHELDGFDPNTHFLVPYFSASSNRHPAGFSGAGVWFHHNTPVVWHPNLGIAGVCTHYYPSRALLKILRIEFVRQFLEAILPH